MMNSASKSSFAEALWTLLPCDAKTATPPRISKHVVDGGALLYRVRWTQGQTFSEIFERYKYYLLYNFDGNGLPTIIFDGYGNATPKDSTHLRRSGGSVGPTVELSETARLTMNRKLFLSCGENKMNFIRLLGDYLEGCGFGILYAEDDADFLTAKTAYDLAMHQDIILVGDDTDLLVLLIHMANQRKPKKELYFCPQQKETSKKDAKVWNICLCNK